MKLSMAREGKGFFGDGIDLGWPQGGAREVIEVSDDQSTWPYRLRERFMNGVIVQVDESMPVTHAAAGYVSPNVLMVGGSPEALAYEARTAPTTIVARAITQDELLGVAPADEAETEAEEAEAEAEAEEAEGEEAEAEAEAEAEEEEETPAPRKGRGRQVRVSDAGVGAEGSSE